jgi:hypothetical protein
MADARLDHFHPGSGESILNFLAQAVGNLQD